jgi:hypothetical protein
VTARRSHRDRDGATLRKGLVSRLQNDFDAGVDVAAFHVADGLRICDSLRAEIVEGGEEFVQRGDGQVSLVIADVGGGRALLDGVGDGPLAPRLGIAAAWGS